MSDSENLKASGDSPAAKTAPALLKQMNDESKPAAAAAVPWWKSLVVSQLDSLRQFILQEQVGESMKALGTPLMVAAGAVFFVLGPRTVLKLVIQSALTVVGVMLGVGLGLGLAAHVSDLLTMAYERTMMTATAATSPSARNKRLNGALASTNLTSSTTNLASSIHPGLTHQQSLSMMMRQKSLANTLSSLEEPGSYASLMQSAGFNTTAQASSAAAASAPSATAKQTVLRGQVMRSDDPYFGTYYRFQENKALTSFSDLFPVIPEPIRVVLSNLVEYILRDFVACWYYKIDAGCVYPVVQEGDKHEDNSGGIKRTSSMLPRRMVYLTGPHRSLPCLDKIYESTVIFAGGLATRVEHVNVLSLVLLQWTQVFAHTFKVYRALRKSVVQKLLAHANASRRGQNPSTDAPASPSPRTTYSSAASGPASVGVAAAASNVKVSEMSMTKEFLLAGKLHRAVTFGMDVPSVLFADAQAKETGHPTEDVQVGAVVQQLQATQPSDAITAEEKILQERLNVIIGECELDYHRVLAHRMVRALLPRHDFNCQILSSLMVEILAGCVLTPLLQTVSSPEYINSWIIMGLGPGKEDAEEDTAETTVPKEASDSTDPRVTQKFDESSGILSESDVKVATPPSDEEHAKKLSDDDATAVSAVDDRLSTLMNPRVEASLTSERGEHVTEATAPNDSLRGVSTADNILTVLGLALIELQSHVDLDEPRRIQGVDWDSQSCRAAVLKLVLVIEAAMTDGRCIYSKEDGNGNEEEDTGDSNDVADVNGDEGPVEVTLPEYESTTLSQILMEMTSDLDAFEERVARENVLATPKMRERFNELYADSYTPTSTEQSTLRTLIAAWLHTGQICRVITVLVQAQTTVLSPFYTRQAFLRIPSNANGFVRKLKALDGVEILVDTMAVLAAPRLQESSGEELAALVHKSTMPVSTPIGASRSVALREDTNQPSSYSQFGMPSSSNPRYLDFNRNEAFATSLRSERERRMQSWAAITQEGDTDVSPLPIVCRTRGAAAEDVAIHKELHHLSRIFYGSTNIVAIRDAARRQSSDGAPGGSVSEGSDGADAVHVSLLTAETASQRRRIEVPDDDSSFLLRAQSRPLNAVGVHRDQRNHDQSFKCFAATYEEPAHISGKGGGRFIRRCQVRYFPIDRTASVALQPSDNRKLDQRKGRVPIPSLITVGHSTRNAPFISPEFLRERHLCQRWVPKGTTRTQSILASSVMEPTDFNLMPRSGRAIDFVYRMSFFERPMVDLGGKHFTIEDSASLGSHRADASALEISDATLSAALLILGTQDLEKGSDDSGHRRNSIDVGPDGYPVIWMRFVRKEEDGLVEMKPYRLSFVRAALMVTAARQEAQLQNLSICVRTGSAKKATKSLTESILKPTARLLEYAGSRSREKQSVLLRDLKLGVNHIDREQLRRNGLLSPRYPTMLRDLAASVEDAVMAHEVQGIELFGATGTVFKIRCVATVDVVADACDLEGDPGYTAQDASLCKTAEEEWIVYRSLKDFQAFHKHIKNQVSVSESSGTAGSRLVGAATAAFATANNLTGRTKHRDLLIPSLAQAAKSGALGVTKKSMEKRVEALDSYLKHFLAHSHMLRHSTELLLFLGALFPLSRDVQPGCMVTGVGDPFGRTEMKRRIVATFADLLEGSSANESDDHAPDPPPRSGRSARTVSNASIASSGSQEEDQVDEPDEKELHRKSRKLVMIPSIGCKIERIHLSQFRHRAFELIRYLFGFDNASFVRNRMLAALKTVSFAVTSNTEFQKSLYNAHVEHLSADSLSSWIKFAIDLLWPDGEFFTSSPPTPVDKLEEQSRRAKEALHASFPEQLRTVLGQELTKDGIDILHEMLQNKVVMKSVGYMLFDLLWLEVFPEVGDVLECAFVLGIEDSY